MGTVRIFSKEAGIRTDLFTSGIRAPAQCWRLLCVALTVTLVTPAPIGAENPASPEEGEPFFFIVMADPQLGAVRGGDAVEPEATLFRRAIRAANALDPEFVLICGDLTHETGSPRQVRTFWKLMREFSDAFPVYLVSGNHDLGHVPSDETLSAYRKTFGLDRYTFDVHGSRFIVLNSTVIVEKSEIRPEANSQFIWFRNELQRARKDGVSSLFVAQHHPWFLKRAREPYRYPYTIWPRRRAPYLELLETHAVRATFAGHTHWNALGRQGGMEMITTASITPFLNTEAPGFRIVRVYPDRLLHEFVSLEDVPDTVDLKTAPPVSNR